MATQRIGGTAYVMVNGAQVALRGKLEYSPMTTSKKKVVGQDGVHGFTETQIAPYIKGEFSDLGGVSVSAFQNIDDDPIVAELDNGKVITLNGAWLEGEVKVDAEEGKYTLEFTGTDGIEQTAA